MTEPNIITYTCTKCGYTNVWTCDEVVRRGEVVIYKATHIAHKADEDVYSLKCRNPQIDCPQRRTIALRREE